MLDVQGAIGTSITEDKWTIIIYEICHFNFLQIVAPFDVQSILLNLS